MSGFIGFTSCPSRLDLDHDCCFDGYIDREIVFDILVHPETVQLQSVI